MVQYQIALTKIPGIGSITIKKLLGIYKDIHLIFKEHRKDMKARGINDFIIEKIIHGRNEALRIAEKELVFIEKHKIQTCFYKEKNYPYRLNNCTDGPVMLYYKGVSNFNSWRVIGIVGTRKATEYGRNMCAKLIEGFSDTEIIIVSGLAYGIDSYAHREALRCNLETIAVLGHGLDRIYPSDNIKLASNIIDCGGLITDFTSGTKPEKENFPKRNRIIAGLCDALIVIEAAKSGGALITAEIANSYNRDVFAVPGRANDIYSEGCNNYIKANKAALIESADDILFQMGWELKSGSKKGIQQKLFSEFTEEEQIILEIIREKGNAGIDIIVTQSGIKSSKVASCLLNLEFTGIIKCLPGKIFHLTRHLL